MLITWKKMILMEYTAYLCIWISNDAHKISVRWKKKEDLFFVKKGNYKGSLYKRLIVYDIFFTKIVCVTWFLFKNELSNWIILIYIMYI